MTIIGFNFTKISVKRENSITGNISIKKKVGIENLRTKEMGLSTNQGALEIDFTYGVSFLNEKKKNVGNIDLAGNFVFLNEKKLITEVIKQYKKDRSIKQEIITPLLNYTFAKCTLEALLLSKEVNLPMPVQLPKLKVGKK
tara:strand:- start:22073 stop:22495 length:423 start_codon:yes stop_codon:yes gene_type:complete